MPRFYNLRQDPYEKVFDESLDFMMSQEAPNLWRVVFLQQQVGKLGESLIAYPPMQKGASFGNPGGRCGQPEQLGRRPAWRRQTPSRMALRLALYSSFVT